MERERETLVTKTHVWQSRRQLCENIERKERSREEEEEEKEELRIQYEISDYSSIHSDFLRLFGGSQEKKETTTTTKRRRESTAATAAVVLSIVFSTDAHIHTPTHIHLADARSQGAKRRVSQRAPSG